MPSRDLTNYIDHADLTAEDFAAFEYLRAYLPNTHPRWELVLGVNSFTSDGQWASTEALFGPTDSPAGAGRFAQVYFDEHGKALPDRPTGPVSSPLAGQLAGHLPGWSVQPLPLHPGRDLADLHNRAWSWSWSGFTSTSAPHTAIALTGPAGEHLLVIRPGEDTPLHVGPARPDDAHHFFGSASQPPEVATFAGRLDLAAVTAEITGTLAPRCQQALWRARSHAAETAVEGLRALSNALIGETTWSDTRDRSIQVFDSEDDRNRRAWDHVEVLLDTGQHLLAGIRSTTHVEDHLDPLAGPDLRRLYVVENALTRLQEIRDGWREAVTALVGPPGTIELLLSRAENLRNEEAWPFSQRLADGPLPSLAAYVAPRIGTAGPSRDQQMNAAVARTTALPAQTTAAAPPTKPTAQPGRRELTR
ncbi:hypothetical protein [Kitasatospora sp. NPDC098663]|uniref:hypothetical protein n=1 Tax=Kitasatospora sp. NPDC098663 TaxID=3364096 RepID=UPI00381A0149